MGAEAADGGGGAAGSGGCSSSGAGLLDLDAEALLLVLRLLSPRDVARGSATCKQLHAFTQTGQHAAQLWRNHCLELLGELAVRYVTTNHPQQASQASTWAHLYSSARSLNELHWCPAAPQPRGLTTVHAAGTQRVSQAPLARCGHTAMAAGGCVVLVGGSMRDGPSATTDVAVLDVAGRRVVQPRLWGVTPSRLAHHCAAAVALQPGSLLHAQVLDAVQAAQQQQAKKEEEQQQQQQQLAQQQQTEQLVAAGHTLAVFGGLLPDGSMAGGQQLQVLWLAPGAAWGTWLAVATSGPAPAPRAFACCQALSAGATMLVYGGWANGSHEGTVAADVSAVDGWMLMCIYLLDVNALSWRRTPTWPRNEPPRAGHAMLGPSTCPGPRKQALSCTRVCPETGAEEFVILGGCGADGLADSVPYALNTSTFVWTKGPAVGYLPPPRDGSALMQLNAEWLLLLGGSCMAGGVLSDVQRLHLPSLSWRPPPRVTGPDDASSGGASAAARPLAAMHDFTATAGVVVGGSRSGPLGCSIVEQLAVLLPGPRIAAAAASTDSLAAGTAAGAGSFFVQHCHLAAQQQGLAAVECHGCCCGSCCSCLQAKMVAAGIVGPPPAWPLPPSSNAAMQRTAPGSLQAASSGSGASGAAPAAPWQQLQPSSATAAASASSKGSSGMQPIGWVSEIELAPAAVQRLPPRQAAAASRGFSAGGGASGGAAGAYDRSACQQREWQAPPHAAHGQGPTLVQVLLALGVLLLGLALALEPSHQ